jgi:hypothetical protein
MFKKYKIQLIIFFILHLSLLSSYSLKKAKKKKKTNQ